MRRLTTAKREDFIARVVAMKSEAAALGLWQTMHAFDAVTCAYGADVADFPARVVTVEVRP